MDTLILKLASGLASLYYRREKLGHDIPADGPLIVLVNHVNGLVDPCLVVGESPRPMRFLAKAPLFDMPVLGALIRAVGAIPVVRSSTEGDKGAVNAQAFEAVHDALARGEAVCVFPEGTSHSDPGIKRVKTGAARMALGAEASNGWSLGVRILSVGLVYEKRGTLKSRVTIWVGEPFGVGHLRERYEADEWGAVEELTADVLASLRSVTVNLEHHEDRPLLSLAEEIWSDTGTDRTRLLQRLSEGFGWLRRNRPERAELLTSRVVDFGYRLRVHGLHARDLDRDHGAGWAARFVAQEALLWLVVGPVLVVGALLWSPPTLLVRGVTAVMPGPVDKNVTVALLASVVLDALWFALVLALVGSWFGVPGFLVCLVGMPALGWAWLWLWGHRDAHLSDLAALLHVAPNRSLQRFLCDERDRIRHEMEALRRMIQAAEARRA